MNKILNFNDAVIALANYFVEDLVPAMHNVTMATKDTEYSQLLATGTKKVLIKLRSGTAPLKLAYVSTESGTNYVTLPVGTSKWLEGAWLSGITLYFQSPTAAQIAEIEAWS